VKVGKKSETAGKDDILDLLDQADTAQRTGARRTPPETLAAAAEYVRHGCAVVPVPRGAKGPRIPAWQNLRLTELEIAQYFSKGENIGILLGEPSGGLIDIDLDAAEALAVADHFLSHTPLVHGRAGKPRSHRWYRVTQPLSYLKFSDPGDLNHPAQSTLVELRQDGHQTLVPPSVHPCGEVLQWEPYGDPAIADVATLSRAVARVAAAALLTRHWPAAGQRHDAALALAGMLLRVGWAKEEVRHFVEAVAEAAGDGEHHQRGHDVVSTAERLNAGRSATGAPALANIVGDAVVQRVREWLGITSRLEIAGLRGSAAPAWPEPLAVEAFHGLAGEFVRAIDPYTEADPAAILLQFLAGFGSIVGRGPHSMVGATQHHSNEFVLIVGRTAKSRKGTSLGEVRAVLGAIDDSWVRSCVRPGLSSGEGVIYHVRDEVWGLDKKGDRVLVDEGAEDKRLLIVESEFASALRVMQREGNTLSPVLRCAWDGLPLGTLTKNSPLRAALSHISIIGHTTMDDLSRYLSVTDQANGFGNRFLVGCAQRSKELPDGGALPEGEAQKLQGKVRKSFEFGRLAGEMRRGPQAREIWKAIYPELSRDDVPGLFGLLTARAEAHVLRLSMTYALLDQSIEILPEHLEAALAVWEYCENSVRHLFGDAIGDPVADLILRALREHSGGFTRTEINNLFDRHKRAEEIDAALALLRRLGRARCEPEQTNGRPLERWFATTGGAK
jgi:hypothetical protein